jgi:hypothetical protein
VMGLHSRIQRFHRGMEAASRLKGIFHFCLHPENLVESKSGFSVLEDILERLIRARDRGDVEILTMSEVAARIEGRHEPFSHDPIHEPSEEARGQADCTAAVALRFKQSCPEI